MHSESRGSPLPRGMQEDYEGKVTMRSCVPQARRVFDVCRKVEEGHKHAKILEIGG